MPPWPQPTPLLKKKKSLVWVQAGKKKNGQSEAKGIVTHRRLTSDTPRPGIKRWNKPFHCPCTGPKSNTPSWGPGERKNVLTLSTGFYGNVFPCSARFCSRLLKRQSSPQRSLCTPALLLSKNLQRSRRALWNHSSRKYEDKTQQSCRDSDQHLSLSLSLSLCAA